MCPLHFPPKTKLVLGSWEEGFPSCISRCAMSIVNGHFLQVLQISVHDAAKLICVSFLEVMLQVDPAPVSKLSMFFFFLFSLCTMQCSLCLHAGYPACELFPSIFLEQSSFGPSQKIGKERNFCQPSSLLSMRCCKSLLPSVFLQDWS